MSSLFRDVLCSTVKKYTEQVCGSSLFLTEGQRRRRRRKRSQASGAAGVGGAATVVIAANGDAECGDVTYTTTAGGPEGQTETLPLRPVVVKDSGDVNGARGAVNGTSL